MLTKRSLILLLLLPVLVAITWFKPGLEQPQTAALTPLLPDEINTIQISNHRGESIKLQRENGHWVMQQPISNKANSHRINELLGISQTPSHTSFNSKDRSLADYGLNPPHFVLQLNELKLQFGNIEPLYQRRYVKIGDQIHLIDDGFQHHLLAPASAFTATGE